MGFEPHRQDTPEDVDEFVSRMERTVQEAQSAMTLAAEDMARFYNAHRDQAEEFAVGDKVWLDARNISTTRPAKKLDDKWLGPYKITHKYSRNAYRLALPSTLKIHPTFHISLLRRFTPDAIATRAQAQAPPPPVTREGHVEYEVEKILDSRFFRRRLKYKVAWKGYDRSHNSWEPAENLTGCRHLVERFHHEHPEAVRCLCASGAAP